jgi:CheY-like chemotaxis protein
MEQQKQVKRIALIDDDPVTNMINTKIVTMTSDSSVVAFTDAQKALEQFSATMNSALDQMPDIIFLDINMPVMDGWEFLDEFQKLPHEIIQNCKVFVLSSSIDQGDVEKAKGYNSVSDFISKPLTPGGLKILIG